MMTSTISVLSPCVAAVPWYDHEHATPLLNIDSIVNEFVRFGMEPPYDVRLNQGTLNLIAETREVRSRMPGRPFGSWVRRLFGVDKAPLDVFELRAFSGPCKFSLDPRVDDGHVIVGSSTPGGASVVIVGN